VEQRAVIAKFDAEGTEEVLSGNFSRDISCAGRISSAAEEKRNPAQSNGPRTSTLPSVMGLRADTVVSI
jgi:hypothetical protein